MNDKAQQHRKFAAAWTYRTPLLTIDYPAGAMVVNADVIEAADLAGILEDSSNGDGNDNGAAKGSAKGRTLNLKG